MHGVMVTYSLTLIPQSRDAIASKQNQFRKLNYKDHSLSFFKMGKSKNKSGNGFPGQRGSYRVQKYHLEKNWSGKF